MRLKLDEFFDDHILIEAKNLVLEDIAQYIKIYPEFNNESIEIDNASLKIQIISREINVELDSIPNFLQGTYQVSNIIEFNKHASSLHLLDFNAPPKYYAAQNKTEKCECYLIAVIIEHAIALIFNLAKFAEFQFYSYSGNYLGAITRVRLNRDLITGTFSIYDCLIFQERYKVEKRHIAMLKDITTIVDKEDYCFQNLPEIIDQLEEFTKVPFVEAEEIGRFEKLHRIKIPKSPLFYRIPFLIWTQQQKAFLVPDESISELIY
jgi:hypothetical protein